MNVATRPGNPAAPKALLGVLGGMGPLATALFYQRLVEATPATRDQDHLPVAVWADPTVPDRSAALTAREAPCPTPWLLRGGRILQSLGAALIAVPCNSAHPFLGAVRTDLAVPVLDIIEATVAVVVERTGAGSRVAVLCTDGLRHAGIYDSALRAAGLVPIDVPRRIGGLVQATIVDIKSGRLPEARRYLSAALSGLASESQHVVVAACTELTALRDDFPDDVLLIDSATVLAQTSVDAIRVLDRHATSAADDVGTFTTTRKAAQ